MFDLGRRVIFMTVIVALAGCARSSPPTAEPVADKAAVEAVSLAWKEAYNARDAAAVTALYGDDAVLSAPGARAVRGKAAIGDYFVKTIAQFSTSGLTVTDEPMGETIASCDSGLALEDLYGDRPDGCGGGRGQARHFVPAHQREVADRRRHLEFRRHGRAAGCSGRDVRRRIVGKLIRTTLQLATPRTGRRLMACTGSATVRVASRVVP
jgi:hypothetical protein